MPTLSTRIKSSALKIAHSVYDRALDVDGSVLYEGNVTRILDDDKHWWTQTEAVVGFVNAYQLSGDEAFLKAAMRVWEFIDRHIDRQRAWRMVLENFARRCALAGDAQVEPMEMPLSQRTHVL